jgi:hypothetical protein
MLEERAPSRGQANHRPLNRHDDISPMNDLRGLIYMAGSESKHQEFSRKFNS